MASYELYRKSSIGTSLTEALEEMVTNGTISPLLAVKVLMQFDKSMQDALQTKVKSKTHFKGHLHTYRFCDNVWTFILENAVFKTDGESQSVDHVKIVACDAKIIAR
jgi:transcription initiation factor TFIIA small subunit